jgi:hypothetical protein
METFDYVILISALAGFVMVFGGMVLIYKGALVLASKDSSDALSIEWKQNFRLNTQAPGIAFFIIGLIFVIVPIFASKPGEIQPIRIEGRVNNIQEPVNISVRSKSWPLEVESSGIVKGKIYPDLELISMEISAPGYRPETRMFTLTEFEGRIVKFDGVELEQEVPPIAGDQRHILEVQEKLEPITAKSSFGAAQ